MHISTVCLVKSQGLQRTLRKSSYKECHCIPNALKNVSMLCMQELFFGGVGGFTIHEDRTPVYLDGDFYFLSFLVINYILIPLRVSQTCFIIIAIFTLEQSS